MRQRMVGERGVASRDQLAGLTGLKKMEKLLQGEFPAPPISETMDFALMHVEFGRAVFQGKPSAKLLNPLGTVHVGKQVATAEGRLMGHDGTLYAHASTTCLVSEVPKA